MLRETPGISSVELVNAGVGGDTVEHLPPRVALDVASHDPNWVVVFIGANDCTTALIGHDLLRRLIFRNGRRYFAEEKGLIGAVTPSRFEAGLRALVEEIRQQTRARVALCAPPPSVEPRSLRWRLMARYADAVRRVASGTGCDLIDLHARWSEAARTVPRRTLRQRWRGLMGELRGDGDADIETLARERGYILTFDGIHFSTQGATLAAEVMRDWLVAAMATTEPLPDQR
jgi:lysophospholipase L1-like esterase